MQMVWLAGLLLLLPVLVLAPVHGFALMVLPSLLGTAGNGCLLLLLPAAKGLVLVLPECCGPEAGGIDRRYNPPGCGVAVASCWVGTSG